MKLVLCIKCKVLLVEEGMVELHGKLLAWFRVEELSEVIAATLKLYLVPQNGHVGVLASKAKC